MRLNVADINECIEGTSECSADAVCNNINKIKKKRCKCKVAGSWKFALRTTKPRTQLFTGQTEFKISYLSYWMYI